jgi:hypothetical protein
MSVSLTIEAGVQIKNREDLAGGSSIADRWKLGLSSRVHKRGAVFTNSQKSCRRLAVTYLIATGFCVVPWAIGELTSSTTAAHWAIAGVVLLVWLPAIALGTSNYTVVLRPSHNTITATWCLMGYRVKRVQYAIGEKWQLFIGPVGVDSSEGYSAFGMYVQAPQSDMASVLVQYGNRHELDQVLLQLKDVQFLPADHG